MKEESQSLKPPVKDIVMKSPGEGNPIESLGGVESPVNPLVKE